MSNIASIYVLNRYIEMTKPYQKMNEYNRVVEELKKLNLTIDEVAEFSSEMQIELYKKIGLGKQS